MADMRGFSGTLGSLALVLAQVAPVPAALAPIGAVAAQAQQQTRTISCASRGNGSNTCRLPANTVSVSFIGPDRTGRCIQGRTYAQRGNGLWVSGGCSGNFEVVYNVGGGNSGGNWGGSGGTSGGNWGGNSGGNWGNQGFAGEITCRSQNNRPQTCRADTQGRAQLLQQYSSSPCIQGQSWRADRNGITVRNGCQGRFGYGLAGNDGWGGSGGNRGFAGQIECRSENNRYVQCPVNTANRVELVRQFSNTACVPGSTWGFTRNNIWVNRGCQGRFGYGFGNVTGDSSGSGSSGGSNTGGIIAGGLLAAGLIAALAAANKGDKSGQSTRGPASVDADWARFPSAARSDAQACLNESARQIGATGGTRVQLKDVTTAQQSGNGWMLVADVTGTWDDYVKTMKMDCRAAGGKVTAFDMG